MRVCPSQLEYSITKGLRGGNRFTLRDSQGEASDAVIADTEAFRERMARLELAPGVRVCGFTIVDVRVNEATQEAEVIFANKFRDARTFTWMGLRLTAPDGGVYRRPGSAVGPTKVSELAALPSGPGMFNKDAPPANSATSSQARHTRRLAEPHVVIRYGSCLQVDDREPGNVLSDALLRLSLVAHAAYSRVVFGFTTRAACRVTGHFDGVRAAKEEQRLE